MPAFPASVQICPTSRKARLTLHCPNSRPGTCQILSSSDVFLGRDHIAPLKWIRRVHWALVQFLGAPHAAAGSFLTPCPSEPRLGLRLGPPGLLAAPRSADSNHPVKWLPCPRHLCPITAHPASSLFSPDIPAGGASLSGQRESSFIHSTRISTHYLCHPARRPARLRWGRGQSRQKVLPFTKLIVLTHLINVKNQVVRN